MLESFVLDADTVALKSPFHFVSDPSRDLTRGLFRRAKLPRWQL